MSAITETINRPISPKSRAVRVIRRDPARDEYIGSHELSLLSLLVRKYPDKAKELVEKSMLTSQTG